MKVRANELRAKGEYSGARVGSGAVGRRRAGISGRGATSHSCKESGRMGATSSGRWRGGGRTLIWPTTISCLFSFKFLRHHGYSLTQNTYPFQTPTPSISACIISTIQTLPPSILDRVSSWGGEITRHGQKSRWMCGYEEARRMLGNVTFSFVLYTLQVLKKEGKHHKELPLNCALPFHIFAPNSE